MTRSNPPLDQQMSVNVNLTAEEECDLARRAQALDLRVHEMLCEAGVVSNGGELDAARRTEQIRESLSGLEDAELRDRCDSLWDQAESARWKLAMSAWDLTWRAARRISVQAYSSQDVASEATVGLYEAAKRFDPDKGVRFTTYARWWVRAQMKQVLSKADNIVHVPESAQRAKSRLSAARRRLATRQSRTPGLGRLCGEAAVSRRQANRVMGPIRSLSLDADDPDGLRLADTLADASSRSPHEVAEERQSLRRLRQVMADGIGERHQRVVCQRFGLAGHERRTLKDIGQSLGVSGERVRQLEREALDVIRERVER